MERGYVVRGGWLGLLAASILAMACQQISGVDELSNAGPDASVGGAAGASGGGGGAAANAGAGGVVGTGGLAGSSGAGGAPCTPGSKLCGGCVPIDDPAFGCADVGCLPCELPHATSQCAGDTCSVASCDAGWADCDDTAGCETDTQTDPNNCGFCGTPCDPDLVCMQGACARDCGTLTDCNSACVDLDTNVSHCGRCDIECSPVIGAVIMCSAGNCVYQCIGGTLDCDSEPNTGCECPPSYNAPSMPDSARIQCDGGQCCSNGLTPCAVANTSLFACVDTHNDPRFCGGCDGCGPNGRCVNGCIDDTICPFGLTLCANRCVNLYTDSNHCGTCEHRCQYGVCDLGICANACSPGQDYCPPTPLTSARCTYFDWDPANCGGCGTVCGQGDFCIGGECRPAWWAQEAWECQMVNGVACTPPSIANPPHPVLCIPDGHDCPDFPF